MLPRLLHPVPVQIQQQDQAATVYDDDFREPVQAVARSATVTAPGQIRWGQDQRFASKREGAAAESDGYVLFRIVDLDALGVSLKREDRIVKMGTIDTDVYVVAVQYEGHYPDQGGPSLVKAYFRDRQPARQTKGV